MMRSISGLGMVAALALAGALAAAPAAAETPDRETIAATVEAQHDATIKALQGAVICGWPLLCKG